MPNGGIFALAEPIAPINAAANGATVYERFEAEPDTMVIAVVDDHGGPVGIVERNQFFLSMAAQYGRALYGHRPISLIMNPAPLVADGATPVADFCGQALAERPSELLQGFIVTVAGRYVGVGSALALLQATNAANHAHAEEMTRLAERLAAAQEAAQASLKAKTQFLAAMSHEIRTPLNGILAVAEILQRKVRGGELRPYLDAITDSGQVLMRLLADALDLSRAEAGRFDLVARRFAVDGLLADLEALWTPRANQKGLTLRFICDAAAGLAAEGDDLRLKQVLNNLISNALKFTDAGEVEVRISARPQGNELVLCADVRDSGVGIPHDFATRMFTPFSQTEEGMARGGAGLGLSICREIVERMQGEIYARPNPDRGSTVGFTARLGPGRAVEAAAPASPGADPSGLGLSILVADDNATNRLVASTLCDLIGCRCHAVEDGAAAVTAAAQGGFDLILMDIKMPRLDGLAAMRQIRALPGPVSQTPIIALTANADPQDAARYRAAGMDAVVAKPIRAEALYAAIQAAMATADARPAMASAG